MTRWQNFRTMRVSVGRMRGDDVEQDSAMDGPHSIDARKVLSPSRWLAGRTSFQSCLTANRVECSLDLLAGTHERPYPLSMFSSSGPGSPCALAQTSKVGGSKSCISDAASWPPSPNCLELAAEVVDSTDLSCQRSRFSNADQRSQSLSARSRF